MIFLNDSNAVETTAPINIKPIAANINNLLKNSPYKIRIYSDPNIITYSIFGAPIRYNIYFSYNLKDTEEERVYKLADHWFYDSFVGV